MYTNVLNLEESIDGNRIKQGDLLQLDGKPAKA